jgi:uncharacterized protein YdhG (YjbR/CyaY superfamily)
MTSSDIDSYLASTPEAHRVVLQKLREQIAKAAPSAIETISYQIPTFKHQGKALLYFASHKDHCSVYPCTKAMLDTCGEELEARKTGKGTIRFTAADPLPENLVTRMVKARVAEIEGGGR